MREVYLAYFDLLGFKEFIENNDGQYIEVRMQQIFLDLERCQSLGKVTPPVGHMVFSDLSESTLNSINISDTILFWTNDCSKESLKEIMEVAFRFNYMMNINNFPMRGVLVKGEIQVVRNHTKTAAGGSKSVQCIFGKGLVDAHLKAESQDWAGAFIDQSVINDIESHPDTIEDLKKKAIKYSIPYKNGYKEEYAFRPMINLKNTNDGVSSTCERVDRVFESDNKPTDNEAVQRKLRNTKAFIKYLEDK